MNDPYIYLKGGIINSLNKIVYKYLEFLVFFFINIYIYLIIF